MTEALTIGNQDQEEICGPEALEIMVRESAGVGVGELVISKIISISSELPDNVNQINSSFADYLAGRFLIGIDLCGELASFASGHTLKMLSLKKREYSMAYHLRAVAAGCKTVKDKEQYPYMDDAYIDADNKYIESVIFEKMVEEKRDLLKKAHYHMRKLADKDPSEGYQESAVTEKPAIQGFAGGPVAKRSSSRSGNELSSCDWEGMLE